MNESKSLANKHCLHLSIFLCSKYSISHCQPSFLMFRFMTLFQSLKLRSHNLFHSISSNLFSLTLLPLNPHSNFPKKQWYPKKQKCGLWGSNSRPWDYETHALPTEPNSLWLAFKTTLYYSFLSTFISCFYERENQDSVQSPLQLYKRREARSL